ncbi:hypothetical protein [Nonomuraea salmonea]|uniref:hypothetical protein n=1 Tax=Nonomuraea salmonea TaxID=46181 RepID=UPI0031EFFD7E
MQHAVRQGEEARCSEVITAVFEEVAGGVPDDLTIATVGRVGDPGYHLVDLAREGDLLVLGRGGGGACSAASSCPRPACTAPVTRGRRW